VLVAFFIALFGVAYPWIAGRRVIDRPLVALGAIGKSSVFAIIVLLWLAGEAPGRIALLAVGDLVFAAIFAWWMWWRRANF
jgi:hypothetical protein